MKTDIFPVSYQYDKIMETRETAFKIPAIQFPANWKIRIVPPFSGATIRFHVMAMGERFVSVYLDCFDNLGCVGSPYWEIYPYDGDCERYDINDIEGLLKGIDYCLNQINQSSK